ncbi:MAG: carbohydrate ABC transporter permease, partial [Rhizobium sp.]
MKPTILYRLMIWAGLAILLIWSLGPIYWTIASSVTPTEDFSTRPIHFFPQHFTLDHYSRLLGIN